MRFSGQHLGEQGASSLHKAKGALRLKGCCTKLFC